MEDKQIYGYIYLIKNLVNSKMYFGITINDFNTRYKHGDISNTHNNHLKHSIEKYGIENFEINEQFDVAYNEDELYDLEDMYICIYNTLNDSYGYNKRRSGHKYKGHGRPNDETKRKISETLKDKPLSEEHKKHISESLKGKPLSETTKQKMSEAHKDKKHSEETKQKMSKNHADFSGNKNPGARIIICLETLEVFTTIKQASEWCGSTNISECCRGNIKSAGKHPITGEKLHWMYYEDYLKLQEEQSNKTQDLVTEVA